MVSENNSSLHPAGTSGNSAWNKNISTFFIFTVHGGLLNLRDFSFKKSTNLYYINLSINSKNYYMVLKICSLYKYRNSLNFTKNEKTYAIILICELKWINYFWQLTINWFKPNQTGVLLCIKFYWCNFHWEKWILIPRQKLISQN